MMRMQSLIAITISIITLVSCSSYQNLISNHLPSEIYATAQQKLQDGNFRKAIIQLELLDNYFPFANYAQQVQLELIYAYYKADDLHMAKTLIDRFMHLNPTHSNADYVLYMRGLISMALDEQDMKIFFSIDHADCNPDNARQAFRDFNELVNHYDNSQYAADATRRLIYLLNRLAEYELSVAQYYNKRQAYVAVINRVETMLRDYRNTQATRYALLLMQNAYKQIHLNDQADKVSRIIAENHLR
ncbi:outer membrane protein assembly factor BamD [Candidatus Profftia tarda]|uniref:Outer membrane protein assembly factor BamD n=1 Tax=Candidatus Profftia tarda TaxID=1177216 RepID=A0A8E4GID8_9ENTR|nr:outer membrane protein assembly factor BamD [Candidatus Profftia tarda]CAD6508979.1 Outer membrane protein assembly factor BamD [Candidatus Profftia tarda]